MTVATPAAIPIRNGTRSVASSVARSASTVGTSSWLSRVVRPCPGKCLMQASAPASWQRRTHVPASTPTISGSLPNDLVCTMGLAGSMSRSASGASTQLMPRSSASRAVVVAAALMTSGSFSAASAPGGGNSVSPGNCCPAPRSRSDASRSGRPARSCSSAVSARTASGLAAEEDESARAELERGVDHACLVGKPGVVPPAERGEDQAAGDHGGVIEPSTRAPRAPVAAGRLPGWPCSVR